MNGPQKIRELFASKKTIVAPGAHDMLTAKIIGQLGFDAVYMTGYGQSASHLGKPDVGLMTMSEMVARAANMVECAGVPVVADADTGFGNAELAHDLGFRAAEPADLGDHFFALRDRHAPDRLVACAGSCDRIMHILINADQPSAMILRGIPFRLFCLFRTAHPAEHLLHDPADLFFGNFVSHA